MTRHVFSNYDTCHHWAHQDPQHGRGPSIFYEGATIYSYGRHFPMARIYRNKAGEALVLQTTATYGLTTAKHLGYMRRACSHMRSIAVPHVGAGAKDSSDAGRHSDNLATLQKAMLAATNKAGRRTTERAVQWDAEMAAELHKDMADYMTFFGIRRKMPALPSFAAAFERARRIENPDPRSKDRRERAAAQRKQAKYATERLAQIDREIGAPNYGTMAWRTDWRLNGAFGGTDGAYRHMAGPIMLRIDGDQIRTSQGAAIPVSRAAAVWALVGDAIAGGLELDLPDLKIGAYRGVKVAPDGMLTVGCHDIPYSELRAMSRALGFAAHGGGRV